jgi:hypothetical protein
LTSENEKESKDWFQSIKENYERSIIEGSEAIAKVQDECKYIEEELERTKDKNHHYALRIALRLLRTQLWVAAESRVALSQDYILALMTRKLSEKMDGTKPNPALDEEVRKAKETLDTHIAKRLSQLFDKDDKGYIG